MVRDGSERDRNREPERPKRDEPIGRSGLNSGDVGQNTLAGRRQVREPPSDRAGNR